jgi:spore germination cell wall hydrolase CwlJ-like protein
LEKQQPVNLGITYTDKTLTGGKDMSTKQRLRSILTWTNMSLMVIALTATNSAYADAIVMTEDNIMSLDEHVLNRQLDCLARNVYYEANGEEMEGKLAVAQVTLNRMLSQRYPTNICAVVSQSATVKSQKVCQFHWYCDPRKSKNLKVDRDSESYEAARMVLLEGHRIDELADVYFFHSVKTRIKSHWPHYVAAQIGNHVFYRRHR